MSDNTSDRRSLNDNQAHLKRIIDDTERRLNILFDGLNNETVPKSAIDQMNQIAKGEFPPSKHWNKADVAAMAARDANAALAMHVDL